MQTVIHPGPAICREHFRIAASVTSHLRSAESVHNYWKDGGTGLIMIRIAGNAMLRPGWQLPLLSPDIYRLMLALSSPSFARRRMTISAPLRVLLVAGTRMHWLRNSSFQREGALRPHGQQPVQWLNTHHFLLAVSDPSWDCRQRILSEAPVVLLLPGTKYALASYHFSPARMAYCSWAVTYLYFCWKISAWVGGFHSPARRMAVESESGEVCLRRRCWRPQECLRCVRAIYTALRGLPFSGLLRLLSLPSCLSRWLLLFCCRREVGGRGGPLGSLRPSAKDQR